MKLNSFLPLAVLVDSDSVSNDVSSVANSWFGAQTASEMAPFAKMGDGSMYEDLWTITETVYDSLSVIGFGLMLLFMSIKLMGEITKSGQPPTHEFLVKTVFHLIIGYIVIDKGYSLLTDGVIPFIDDIYDTVTNSITGGDDPSAKENAEWLLVSMILGDSDMEGYDTWQDAWDNQSGWSIASWMTLKIYWMIGGLNYVLDYVPIIFLVARGIEMCAYTMVAPIALADVSNGFEFMSTPAMRFVKKYAGLALQGLMIMIAVLASRILQASVSSYYDGAAATLSFVYSIAIKLAIINVVQRSQQLATDIVGA